MNANLQTGHSRHSPPMPVRLARRYLDELRDHRFIDGWHEENGWFWVDFPGAHRWYSRTQIGAFVDGARAMGAGS